MGLGHFLLRALSSFTFVTSALPSDLRSLNLANEDINSINSTPNTTTPKLLTAHPVSCLERYYVPALLPSDCGYVLNTMILQEPNLLKQRIFKRKTYMTDSGLYTRSRWQYSSCEVEVFGHMHTSQLLTLLGVAFTADRIFNQCVKDTRPPKGGLSLLGDVNKGFHVILRGYTESESVSAKNSSVSQQPAASVSRRGVLSRHHSEGPARAQSMETRDPLTGVSHVANHSIVTSISTIGLVRPPIRYPIHCFNPLIIHLQPAAATDCGIIITQIILRLFVPTRQLTFGFTDAEDINLSRPEYQKWQYGQCMISVKNDDVTRVDTFRLLDVAATARRITMQCLVNSQDKVGGVSDIGTDGRGFYVYVGGPLDSSASLGDVRLFGESRGVKSS